MFHIIYMLKRNKVYKETSNSLTRTQLTVFKNWLPRNFKLVLLTHENIECSSLQLCIIGYTRYWAFPFFHRFVILQYATKNCFSHELTYLEYIDKYKLHYMHRAFCVVHQLKLCMQCSNHNEGSHWIGYIWSLRSEK